MPLSQPEKSVLRQVFEASTVGIHFVLCTIAGLLVGYGLDKWLNTFPYLTGVFFIMGIIAGFSEVLRIARKVDKNQDEDRKNN